MTNVVTEGLETKRLVAVFNRNPEPGAGSETSLETLRFTDLGAEGRRN